MNAKTERVAGIYRELRCPECQRKGGVYVIDSRVNPKRQAIRRRRRCNWCGFRFTTYEILAAEFRTYDPLRARKALLLAHDSIASALAVLPEPAERASETEPVNDSPLGHQR